MHWAFYQNALSQLKLKNVYSYQMNLFPKGELYVWFIFYTFSVSSNCLANIDLIVVIFLSFIWEAGPLEDNIWLHFTLCTWPPDPKNTITLGSWPNLAEMNSHLFIFKLSLHGVLISSDQVNNFWSPIYPSAWK